MKAEAAFAWLIGAALAGCTALPMSGPSARAVLTHGVADTQRRYDVVTIDERVVRALLAVPGESFATCFKHYGKPPPPRIGIGDTLGVTIWEAAAGGLFGTSPLDQAGAGSHSVTIPAQPVGADGAISVPFAGRVPVAGKLPLEAGRAIARRLAHQAIEPQVLVTVQTSVTDTVTVTGEVVAGARVRLSLNGDRLLDVIAAAGGAKAPVYETFVRLSRDGVTATMPLAALIANPAENIYARPGDVLTLVRAPRAFSVLGATGSNARVAFGAERLSLIEALAKAGGLLDARSDPAGVFLFRFEPPRVVAAIGVPPLPVGPDGGTPVVYRLDMNDPEAYFLAQRFPVENRDVIYVANAELDQLQKFFALLGTVTGPVLTGAVIKNAVP